MRDKMAISAYILKIVEKDPFLRLQIITKEDSIITNFFQFMSTKNINYHCLFRIKVIHFSTLPSSFSSF